ncbi:GAF domain-containing protein [Macrococcoides caseolyticum]|uniref:GAF domain-containing protein n=1 Tax=Macrococcoides caseolyticum TaxID=69966 RepID=UPI001F37EF90|nr:GAF domain-containing protein [Macrococcus caseolyticus]MCE4956495.1 GAF domain-containing protein [Macrococcus caseolyticus]
MDAIKSHNYQAEVDELREKLNVDFVGLAMPSDLITQTNIHWTHVSGALNERYKKIELQKGKGIAGFVFKSGRAWIELDVASSNIATHLFDFPIVRFERLTNFMALPLWKYNKVAAVLLLGNRDKKPFSLEIYEEVNSELDKGFGALYRKDVINSAT